MKGAEIINTQPNSSQFGNLQNIYHAGKYEFILVANKIGNQLIFTTDMTNYNVVADLSYNVAGKVQVVRVPGYSKARVTSKLLADPWNPATGKGGVITMFVGNTLFLDDTIDASSDGFKGAPVAGYTLGCSTSDPSKFDNYYFSTAFDSAGYMGESFVTYKVSKIPITQLKGRGHFYNGGGGGNAKYAGGGGGGNYGTGGLGGIESEFCGGLFLGGLGGSSITLGSINFAATRRIFLGGGGGGGTQLAANNGTGGGSGGGIIVIVADTIIGNDVGIVSRGGSVTQIGTNNGSGGGGGAGGTIALDITTIKGNNFILAAPGGSGGSVALTFPMSGAGGGGGGGLVWHSMASLPGGVSANIDGGFYGDGGDASAGNPGNVQNGLKVTLTGFLFNSITIKASNDLKDTICEGDVPGIILGSTPKGGITPYTYSWESSLNKVAWNTVPAATAQNYSPSAPLTDTVYYRRIVKDSGGANQITDVSKPVVFIMQPKIINNVIQIDIDSDTICKNQAPAIIDSPFPEPSGGNGPGSYTYTWQESIDNVNWMTIAGAALSTYSSPAMPNTKYFRRIVRSGIGCPDTSNVIKIFVLPLISNNSVAANQVICEGSQFVPLTGTNPAGGKTGDYRFKWLQSLNGTTWNDAYGPRTAINYAPDTTSPAFPSVTPVLFKRVVYSGPLDVCRDTSANVSLTQWPRIRNNLFTVDQVLCEGVIPAPVTANLPTGGNGIYTYQWQDSLPGGSWQNRAGATNKDISFTAPFTDSTFFRRKVSSNVCMNISPVDTISVHPSLQNFDIQTMAGITDTTICFGQVPHKIIPKPPSISGGDGTYTYTWENSTDGGTNWNATGGNTSALTPPALNLTTLYRRNVISGQCSGLSNTVTVTVLPALANNTLPANRTICTETTTLLNASTPTGGAGAGSYTYLWQQSPDNLSWSSAGGANNTEDYTTQVITATTYFRRIVNSGPAGCCQDISSSVRIDVYPLPTGNIADPAASVCSGSSVNVTLTLTGTAPWNAVLTDGSSDVTINTIGASPHVQALSPTTAAQSTLFQFTIKSLVDGNGCVAKAAGKTGQANITVFGMPLANAGSDDQVCGLNYTMQAVLGPYGTGTWTFPAAVIDVSNNTNPNKPVQVNAQGTYNFIWTVVNGPCTATDNVNISFWDPVSLINLLTDTTLLPYITEVQLKGQVIAPVVGTLLWTADVSSGITFTPPDAEITLVGNLSPGTQTVKLTITNGACSDEYPVDIIVPVSHGGAKGLSPNGDGLNDYFKIYVPLDKSNELIIMNRWGNVVYKEKNFMVTDMQGWDGRDSNGHILPDDTYYYILTVEGFKTFTGFIIIRGGSE